MSEDGDIIKLFRDALAGMKKEHKWYSEQYSYDELRAEGLGLAIKRITKTLKLAAIIDKQRGNG